MRGGRCHLAVAFHGLGFAINATNVHPCVASPPPLRARFHDFLFHNIETALFTLSRHTNLFTCSFCTFCTRFYPELGWLAFRNSESRVVVIRAHDFGSSLQIGLGSLELKTSTAVLLGRCSLHSHKPSSSTDRH